MRKIVIVIAIACVAAVAAFGAGCTTTKVVVVTPTPSAARVNTPTITAPPTQTPERSVPATTAPEPTMRPVVPTTAPPVDSGCPRGCTSQQAGCVIKGNISSSGEKIYHIPGGGSYTQTVISPDKGERWFCTDAEAVANGWRKAKN